MAVVNELWRFARVRKKYWLLPLLIVMFVFGGSPGPYPGQRRRAIYLYVVLSCVSMRILGLSAFYHDSAAALVAKEGRRRRAGGTLHTQETGSRLSANAVLYWLAEGKCGLGDLEVVFYDKPFVKFERLLQTYLAYAPKGCCSFRMAVPLWMREKLFQKDLLLENSKN